jgi:hypothetical protein
LIASRIKKAALTINSPVANLMANSIVVGMVRVRCVTAMDMETSPLHSVEPALRACGSNP